MVGGADCVGNHLPLPEWAGQRRGRGMELGSGPLMECTLQPIHYNSGRRKVVAKKCASEW